MVSWHGGEIQVGDVVQMEVFGHAKNVISYRRVCIEMFEMKNVNQMTHGILTNSGSKSAP